MPKMPNKIKRSFIPIKKAVESIINYPEYHTNWWRKKRIAILKRDNYLCVVCEQEGRITEATVCDHTKPVKEFDSFMDATYDDNLQSLCKPCHDVKRAKEKL